MSEETVERSSKVVGEFRVRGGEWLERWPADAFLVSGPERITTIESRRRLGLGDLYADPSECRRIAEKLYAAEMCSTSEKRLKFAEIADVFSLGSIMNGVVM